MRPSVAQESKKRYDMRVKPATYKWGIGYITFAPGQRFYSGPFLVLDKLGTVNLRIQRSARANPMVVHVDKVKHCMGTTPASWLGTRITR